MGRFHIEAHRRLKEMLGDNPEGAWGDHLDVRYEFLRIVRGITQGKTLDVGCGPGLILSYIGGGTRVALDNNESFLTRAKSLVPDALFVRGDMYNLAFPKSTFDRVLMMGVMEKNPARPSQVRDAARVLKPGGTLYINSPNPLFSRYRPRREHVLSLDEVTEELSGLGFHIIRASGYNPVVFFLMGRGSRALSRLPGIEHILAGLARLPWRVVKRLAVSYLIIAKKV